MDELMQYIMDEGKVEGIKEGREEGIKEGIKEGQMGVIQWMINHPDATPEQAMTAFGLSDV